MTEVNENINENVNENGTSEDVSSTEVEKTADELKALNEKLYAEVKDLRAESKDRRLKLAEFEKAEQKKAEMDLEISEKLALREKEIEELKSGIEKSKLTDQYVDELKKKGFSDKIAKLSVPNDLTSDNLLDSVKKFDKEYKEFKVKDQPDKPQNSFLGVQPGTAPEKTSKSKSLGDFARDASRGK